MGNVGNDLIRPGSLEEGATALYQARKPVKDPTSPLAADIWGKIIAIESSRGNAAVAHQESQAFLAAAGPATPAAFRGAAFLAAANIDIDDQHYDDAVARVHATLAAIKGAPDALVVANQANRCFAGAWHAGDPDDAL